MFSKPILKSLTLSTILNYEDEKKEYDKKSTNGKTFFLMGRRENSTYTRNREDVTIIIPNATNSIK